MCYNVCYTQILAHDYYQQCDPALLWQLRCVCFPSTARTTTEVWMVAITQPTVRMSSNSAGSSLMTTRCLISPPPPSSPLRPTSCFTPPCDPAVGETEKTLHLSRTRGSWREDVPFNLFKLQPRGPGAHSCRLTRRVCMRGRPRAGDSEIATVAD